MATTSSVWAASPLLSVGAVPMMMKMMMTTLMMMVVVEGFPFGAPPFACKNMRPNHEGVPQPEATLPVSVTLYPANTPIWPGDTLQVEIAGKEKNFTFEGMLATMQAVGDNATLLPGFALTNTSNFKLIPCVGRGGGPETAVTHRRRLATHGTSFRWTVPRSARVGDTFMLRLTVVENFYFYWVRVNTTFTIGQPLPPPPSPALPSPTSPTFDGGRPFGTGSTSHMTSSGLGNGRLNEPEFRQQGRQPPMSGHRPGPALMTNPQQGGPSLVAGQLTGLSPQSGHTRAGFTDGQGRRAETNFVGGTHNQPALGSAGSSSSQGQSPGSGSRSGGEEGKMAAWLAGWFGQP